MLSNPPYGKSWKADADKMGGKKGIIDSRFIELLQNCVTGIREGQNIDYSKLRNHLIPIPPRPEQDQIVRYLDWKVSQIDNFSKLIYGKANIAPKLLESHPESLLSLLQEYRTSLISDVVTGKVNVQEEKVPEFTVENADTPNIGQETDGDIDDE